MAWQHLCLRRGRGNMIKEKITELAAKAGQNKKKTAVIAVAAVAAAAICISRLGGGAAGGPGGQGGPGGMAGGAMGMTQMDNMATVAAEQPKTGSVYRTTSLSGTVEASDVIYIYAKASGDVTSVNIKAGDMVQAGDLLCTIDTEQVENALNSMESAAVKYQEAQSTLNRMKLLYDGGDISDQEWEQYQNSEKTARLQYESAKLTYERQVEYSSVTAPISGKIESCDVEVYDRVNQSAQLCVISGEGEKRVDFYVTERVVENLAQGDKLFITKNGKEYEGTITDVSTMADESNGLFKIKAELPEANAVATGSVVKVTVTSAKSENVMTVPVNAIYYDGGVGNVYLYEDGTVHKIQVEVGLYDSERAEIISGLSGDEMVISSWSSQLYEGSKVNLKGEEAQAAADGTVMPGGEAAPDGASVPDGKAPAAPGQA